MTSMMTLSIRKTFLYLSQTVRGSFQPDTNVSNFPGLNRTVVYSLVDSINGVFSIDPVSGMVILEKSLDRESQDSYRLQVKATDQDGQQGALFSQVGGMCD